MRATLCGALMVLVASTASAQQIQSQERAVKPETAKPPTSAVAPGGRPSPSDWERQIRDTLRRNVRYPVSARSRGEQGVTLVVFTINRQGKVTSAHIARSSGSAILDEETLALVHRVSFTPPPAEMNDLRFSLPVGYNLLRYPCGWRGISTGADCL